MSEQMIIISGHVENRFMVLYHSRDGFMRRAVSPAVFDKVDLKGTNYFLYKPQGITSEITYHIRAPKEWRWEDVENVMKTQVHPHRQPGPRWV